MTKVELGQMVVVFDLDDTLYAERDYQTSGIKAVCAFLNAMYHRDITPEILALRDTRSGDLWGEACRLLDLSAGISETLLWIYRLHAPDISLEKNVSQLIAIYRSECRQVAILTDGRALSQRLKLQALGLADLPCFISEECGSAKPDDARFLQIMDSYPAKQYVYIGDNPNKDFFAPNALGWLTIGVEYKDFHIHQYDLSKISLEAMPNRWVNNLADVEGILGSI